jgi:8-amino-7-oxononanoate synthase
LNEEFLDEKLKERIEKNAFRSLRLPEGQTDFCSNDYLGIATNRLIEKALTSHAHTTSPHDQAPADPTPHARHGSTGSRLLAGNYPLIEATERSIAAFHAATAGLIFNSGYDANLGLLSCVPGRGDTVLYDQLSHASIRDGIRLSFAGSFSFLHNDLADLEKKLQAAANPRFPAANPKPAAVPAPTGDKPASATGTGGNIFVVTESVFSMDGDMAPLPGIAALCERYGAHLIVDEAHATGVVGDKGEGLVQLQGLQGRCFARVHTFGKAVGCHGAIVLGSPSLRDYLINFSRPFIYTTAIPETSVVAIRSAYELFPGMKKEREQLRQLIGRFQEASLRYTRLDSQTPIQVVIVPGNSEVKELAQKIQAAGLDVRPILYPTVPRGGERLRIVLHAFNSVGETDALTGLLS